MDKNLIAPCGMNCAICMAYLREKNKCPGCRNIVIDTSVSRARCRIKKCEELVKNKYNFCYECSQFPCKRIKHLDKRYRTKYNMSEIENLEFIRDKGMDKFLEKETKRWKCPKCGGVIDVHHKECSVCGEKVLPTGFEPV